jgi:hypothetical protein
VLHCYWHYDYILDAGFAGGALVREVRPSPRHSPQYAK